MYLCIYVYKEMSEMHALNSSGQCLFLLWASSSIWFRVSCWGEELSLPTHVCGVEVLAQERVALLHEDPGSLLHGLGVNASWVGGSPVKEETT